MDLFYPLTAATWDMAHHFRDQLDMVNALELYEALSGSLEDAHQQTQQAAIDKGVPSFLSAFLPKSGGTYLHGRLISAGAAEIFNHTPSPLDYDRHSYLVPGWIRFFLRGGASCHTHLRPTPWNIRVLNNSGAKKLWVHVRDPRQAALSAYWHGQGLGQGSGEAALERAAMEAELKHIHQTMIGGIYIYDMPKDEQLRSFFERFLTWITCWWKAQDRISPEILFTTYEQMLSDREGFESKVLTFHGAEHLHGVFNAAVTPRDRFRLGQAEEWLTALDKPTRDWMTDQMTDETIAAFSWKR